MEGKLGRLAWFHRYQNDHNRVIDREWFLKKKKKRGK